MSMCSASTLTPTSSLGSNNSRFDRRLRSSSTVTPPAATRAELQRAAFMRSRAAARRVDAPDVSFDSPLHRHHRHPQPRHQISMPAASSSPIERCRSRSVKAPPTRRMLADLSTNSRKTSLVDATPQSVKSCLRKLSVQFSQSSVVREVRGLLDTQIEEARDATKDDAAVAAAASDTSEEEDDLEVRAQVEREEIVERYDRAWENPEFELYTKTDRYGFVHKETLRSIQEKKDKERERRRALKWDRMYRDWHYRWPEKLNERIWKGVPDSYRLKVWRRLLNVDAHIERNGPNTYAELLMRGKLLSTEVRQIDVDVARTYRDHVMFMKRYNTPQQSVFNVLVAYSMFNTEVGYCQGMNTLAAILLMYLGDEEAAFWGLHSLITDKKFTMHGFFVPGFPKLYRFSAHFDNVIKKYLPKLSKHIEKEDIPNAYHAKWWFGMYIDRIPFSLAMRVWDVFLHIGDAILIAMAYNIMKMHMKPLLKTSLEGFMDLIQNQVARDFGYTDDEVMRSLRKCLERLQDDKMALPPAPKKNEVAEVPIKTLGPVLRRSMIDIRMDIAELHSRSSRTNSIAGRSPAFMARRTASQQRSSISHSTHNSSQTTTATSSAAAASLNGAVAASERSATTATSASTSTATNSNNTAAVNSPIPLNQTPTGSGRRRAPPPPPPAALAAALHAHRNGRVASGAPMPIPDADGFVPLTSARNRHSFYDNVTPSASASASGSTSGGSAIFAKSSMSRGAGERPPPLPLVHRAANNVTYVAVRDSIDSNSEQPPASPTPDYDDDDDHQVKNSPALDFALPSSKRIAGVVNSYTPTASQHYPAH